MQRHITPSSTSEAVCAHPQELGATREALQSCISRIIALQHIVRDITEKGMTMRTLSTKNVLQPANPARVSEPPSIDVFEELCDRPLTSLRAPFIEFLESPAAQKLCSACRSAFTALSFRLQAGEFLSRPVEYKIKSVVGELLPLHGTHASQHSKDANCAQIPSGLYMRLVELPAGVDAYVQWIDRWTRQRADAQRAWSKEFDRETDRSNTEMLRTHTRKQLVRLVSEEKQDRATLLTLLRAFHTYSASMSGELGTYFLKRFREAIEDLESPHGAPVDVLGKILHTLQSLAPVLEHDRQQENAQGQPNITPRSYSF